MTIDLTRNSITRVDQPSNSDRLLSLSGAMKTNSFGADLQTAQLLSSTELLETLAPNIPKEEQEKAEDPNSILPQTIWLSGTFQLRVEQQHENNPTFSSVETKKQVDRTAAPLSQSVLNHLFEAESSTSGTIDHKPTSESPSIVIETITPPIQSIVPSHTFDKSPANSEGDPHFAVIDGGPRGDLPVQETASFISDQLPVPAKFDDELHSFDLPRADLENSSPDNPPTPFIAAQRNDLHDHVSHTPTPTLPSHSSTVVDPRPDLSEVVRHVHTIVTDHETRSTIQLTPAELGRMTLEVIDAPDGLRAHLSAEDPSVQRFLENNVQLLESEVRVQGIEHMSFSVGADVSGGLGRGHPRQTEAEASFRKTLEDNSLQHIRFRSRRELDMNA